MHLIQLKGRKNMLGSSSSFSETSKVMPVVEYKTSVFLKVGSCTMKYSFSRFLTQCHRHQHHTRSFTMILATAAPPQNSQSYWLHFGLGFRTPYASIQLFSLLRLSLRPSNTLVSLEKQHIPLHTPKFILWYISSYENMQSWLSRQTTQ